MMKKLLSIATLMLIALMLNAQPPTWQVQNSGFSYLSTGIQWISAPTSQVVWATGYDGSGGGLYYRSVTKTINGGTNWVATNIPAGQIPAALGLSTISAIDANTAFINAFHPTGLLTGIGVYKTTNGGTNWALSTTGLFVNSSSFNNNAGFWDAQTGIVQGDAWANGGNEEFELYTTTNGGTNWAMVTLANLPNALSGEDGWTTSFFHATFGTNKCAYFGTNKGRIYTTTNGGVNWIVASTPFADCAGSIAFTDINNGVAICNAGTGGYLGFARTTNGGVNWSAQTASGIIYKSCVSAVPGRLGWYIRTGALLGESGSQVSFDYGVSWTSIDNIDQHTFVYFFDRDNGWSGGFTTSPTVGGMYKFVPGAIGIDFNSIERNELNVYPNPCTGNFSLINAENSEVSIYNTTGSLVYQSKTGNDKSISIDLTNQAKGMYIIQVKNDSGVRTQKLSIN